jgi:hypothetical protein
MTHIIAIDSNVLTYFNDAISPDYDPILDHINLACEKIAILRIYLYTGVSFYLVPSIHDEYSKIKEAAKYSDHLETAFILCNKIFDQCEIAKIENRKNELINYHKSEKDCRMTIPLKAG